MAFNINAQIILSAPKNLNKITRDIKNTLGKVSIPKFNLIIDNKSVTSLKNINTLIKSLNDSVIKLNSNLSQTSSLLQNVSGSFRSISNNGVTVAKSQNQIQNATNNVNQALQQQSNLAGGLVKRFSSVAKTAIAFGLISRPIYDLQRSFTQAVKGAIDFEKEIVKISQVTGQSIKNLNGLRSVINNLSTTLGSNANTLAETARVITQTGKTAEETSFILNALARSELAPTFGNIIDTTEGLIAALGQFNLNASDSEAILGSLNEVSKNFAVESEDLISAIRRTGGVFAQAAGQSKGTIGALQELSAIFTAVRSTTRESADTIAAGLRTIFSRIQRRGTIEFLKQFNIDLTDTAGNFIGIFPAFDQLSNRLDTLIKQGDALTLSAIAEELGGIRQIGKLLPAIAQFDKARKALEDAQRGAAIGLEEDVAKGLDTIDNRIRRVQESFNQFIRTIFESDAFQSFAKNILTTSESLLKFASTFAETIEPILPLLTTIGAFKIGSGISSFIGGGGLGNIASTVTGSASASASQAAAQASQTAAQATQLNTQTLNTINLTLGRTSNQLANIFTSLESSFTRSITQTANIFTALEANFARLSNQMSNLIQALGGFTTQVNAASNKIIGFSGGIPIRSQEPNRVIGFAGARTTRATGGEIPKFKDGGWVKGPSHAAGGVIAELEGGEYVIPKQYAQGTLNRGVSNISKTRKNRAYVFDFDDTLAISNTTAQEFFSEEPNISASRQNKIRNARITSLADSARKRSAQGYDVHVLTARQETPQDKAALQDFLAKASIKAGRTIFTGGLFQGETEPGKRPGTTRKISTATKKARILAELSKDYDSILFLDDAIENVLKAKEISNVKAIGVDKKTQSLQRVASGGTIQAIKQRFPSVPKQIQRFEKDNKKLNTIQNTDLVSVNIKKVPITAKEINRAAKNIGPSLLFKKSIVEGTKPSGKYKGNRGLLFEDVVSQIKKKPKLSSSDPNAPLDFISGDAKFKKQSDVKDIELIGKVFRDSLGYEAGATGRNKSKLKRYTKKTPESQNFGNVNLYLPAVDSRFVRPDSTTFRKELESKKFGGVIQSFALGDIVKQSSVGAAILDPDEQNDSSVTVTVKNIESKLGYPKDTKSGFSGLGSVFKARSYKIDRQGLNKNTSDKFNNVLNDGLVNAINSASSEIGQDLGVGPAIIDKSSINNFINSQRATLRGDLFEATLLSLNNKGVFDNSLDPSRPFDFPGGLRPPLKDNFDRLPQAFVDAKSSFTAASDSSMKTKITDTLGQFYKTQGFSYKDVIARKEKEKKNQPNTGLSSKEQEELSKLTELESEGKISTAKTIRLKTLRGRSQSKALGGIIQSFADGGVPVRISNGEAIVPAQSAKGRYNELKTMNKTGEGNLSTFSGTSIAKGPGSGTSDSIYTTLNPGDFVIKERSTKKMQKKASGGVIQKLVTGGIKSSESSVIKLFSQQLIKSGIYIDNLSSVLFNFRKNLQAGLSSQDAANKTLKKFGIALQALPPKVDQVAKSIDLQRYSGKSTERRQLARERLNRIKQSGDQPTNRFKPDLLGIAFAAQTLAATMTDADSATSQFINQLLTTITTLSLLQNVIPQGSIGKVINSAKGGFGIPGIGGTVAGTAALGVAGAVGGGFAGRFLGQQAGNLLFGEEQKIGSFRGSANAEEAGSRQKTTQVLTSIGAGAGLGAAIGSVVPVIGTALGAVIGGSAGFIIGAIVPPFGDAAQQAAFETAKSLQESGKTVSQSLEKLGKDFNSVSFRKFAVDVNEQTEQLRKSIPSLVENFDASTVFRGRRNAELEVTKSLTEIIKPEDIQKQQAAVGQAVEKLFANISTNNLNNVINTENLNQLNLALASAAKAGDQYAKEVLITKNQLASQEAFITAARLSGSDNRQEQSTGIILRKVAENFDFVTGSANELEKAISKAAEESNITGSELDIAKTRVREFAIEQKNLTEEQIRSIADQQQLSRSLKESAQIIDAFNIAVQNSIKGLSEGLARSQEQFNIFAQRVQDIESGSGAVRIDNSLENRSNDEIISIIERITNTSLSQFRNLEQVQQNLPTIIKNAVETIPATAGAEQSSQAIIQAINQQTGLTISGAFEKGLADRIRGLVSTRQQEGQSTILAGAKLQEVLQSGDNTQLQELLGPAVEGINSAFEQVIQSAQNLRENFEKRINFEINQLQKRQVFEEKILSRRLANEDLISNILNKNSNAIDKSLVQLQQRLQSTVGTTDLGLISNQRQQSRNRQQELQQQVSLGDTSLETANELINLADQIQRADAALKQFAEDTSFAAAIQQEANKIQQAQSTLTGGLDQLISTVFTGNQEQVQGLGLEIQTVNRVISGFGSIQDAINVFTSANNPIIKAITESRLGEGGTETLQSALRFQLAQQLQGTPFGGIASDLLKNISDNNVDLRTLAQRANDFAQEQIRILQVIESQNQEMISQAAGETSPFAADVKLFSDAVKNFSDTVNSGGAAVFNTTTTEPLTRAKGGIIYRNMGGMSDSTLVGAYKQRFSKGTDTVPAMLTPGEYVVSAPAVKKVGIGTLNAINSGKVTYRQDGGIVDFEFRGRKELSKYNPEKTKVVDYFSDLKDSSQEYPPLSQIKNNTLNYMVGEDASNLKTVFSKYKQDDFSNYELFDEQYSNILKKFRENFLSETFVKSRIDKSQDLRTYDTNSIYKSLVFGTTDKNFKFYTPDYQIINRESILGTNITKLVNNALVPDIEKRKSIYQKTWDKYLPIIQTDESLQNDFYQSVIEQVNKLKQLKTYKDNLSNFYNKDDINYGLLSNIYLGADINEIFKNLKSYDQVKTLNNDIIAKDSLDREPKSSINKDYIISTPEYSKQSPFGKLLNNPRYDNWMQAFRVVLVSDIDKYAEDPFIKSIDTDGYLRWIDNDILGKANNAKQIYESVIARYNNISKTLKAKAEKPGNELSQLSEKNPLTDEYLYTNEKLEQHLDLESVFDNKGKIQNTITRNPISDLVVQQELQRRKNEDAAVIEADPRVNRQKRKDAARQEQIIKEEKIRRAKEERLNKILNTDNSLNNLALKRNSIQQQVQDLENDLIADRVPRIPGIQRLQKLKELNSRYSILIDRRYNALVKKVGLNNDPLIDALTPDERKLVNDYNTRIASALAGNNQDFDIAENIFKQIATSGSENSERIINRIQNAKAQLFGNAFADRPVQKFHTGGFVKGFASGGEVPIIAQQGEYVMNRKAVQRNGIGIMNAINDGVAKFHTGGLVYKQQGGAVNNVNSSISSLTNSSNQSTVISNGLNNVSTVLKDQTDIQTESSSKLDNIFKVNEEILETNKKSSTNINSLSSSSQENYNMTNTLDSILQTLQGVLVVTSAGTAAQAGFQPAIQLQNVINQQLRGGGFQLGRPFNEGGLVYKESGGFIYNKISGNTGITAKTKFLRDGGNIFKPRGTDTVPAMLTPGEFVMRRSAVQKYGVSQMEQINKGKIPMYASQGGLVSSSSVGVNNDSNTVNIPTNEISDAIINAMNTGSNNFSMTLQATFNQITRNLSSAMQPLNNIPETITTTVQPIQVEGVEGFANAISSHLEPKIRSMVVDEMRKLLPSGPPKPGA